jgi:hypothetical protein
VLRRRWSVWCRSVAKNLLVTCSTRSLYRHGWVVSAAWACDVALMPGSRACRVCFPAKETWGREVVSPGIRLTGSHAVVVPTTCGWTRDCPGPGQMEGAEMHFDACRCRSGGVRLAITLVQGVVGVRGGVRRDVCRDELRKNGKGELERRVAELPTVSGPPGACKGHGRPAGARGC